MRVKIKGSNILPPNGGLGEDSLELFPTMRHFRKKPPSANATNDPPPTPTPPILEYIKRELATFHPRAKDRRALAASSSAIAISIASPSSGPIDTTLNDSGSSKESVWKTAYGAARMAVEIANASSDMFLPLKAVVGALSVLMKNYDVGSHSASLPIDCSPFPAANHRQCGSDQRS